MVQAEIAPFISQLLAFAAVGEPIQANQTMLVDDLFTALFCSHISAFLIERSIEISSKSSMLRLLNTKVVSLRQKQPKLNASDLV